MKMPFSFLATICKSSIYVSCSLIGPLEGGFLCWYKAVEIFVLLLDREFLFL